MRITAVALQDFERSSLSEAVEGWLRMPSAYSAARVYGSSSAKRAAHASMRRQAKVASLLASVATSTVPSMGLLHAVAALPLCKLSSMPQPRVLQPLPI